MQSDVLVRNDLFCLRPEYGRLAGVLLVTFIISLILATYLEVVLRWGMAGCSPDALQEFSHQQQDSSSPNIEHCANIRMLHVFVPLLLRQVN
jgi:hypothetical protein